MPRLNELGQATTGYARCWFSQSSTVANDHGTEIRTSDGELLADEPCNFVYSNGAERWMAFSSPSGGPPKVFGDDGSAEGFELLGAGMPLGNGSDPVGPDGSMLYKRAFNSAGPYGFLNGPDIPGDFDQIQNLGGFRAIGQHNGAIRAFNLAIAANLRGYWPVWRGGHLLYQAEPGELVLDGRVIGPIGNYFRPDFLVRADGSFYVVWSQDSGESVIHSRTLTASELAACPPWMPPAPPRTIGPVSGPRPSDGRAYDIIAYILGHPGTWPRSGPTHPMHQFLAGDLFHFVKFGTIVPSGEAYETWGADANWIYHLEDASAEPYHFTDPRWFPRTMQIGETRGFDSGPHETVFTKRYVCNVWKREPWRRRMWVQAVYDKWYWGPDLGERETLVIAYDPTGGFHIPGRNVELGYYALGAGSCRWESYHSEMVYAGGGLAVFTPEAMESRSDFYLLGGPALAPKLTGCVKQVCPHLPAWQTEPPPVVEPYLRARTYP